MVDDCFTKANQEKYIQGMKDFESYVKKKTGKPFAENNEAERQAIVAELDQQKTANDNNLAFFYQSTKKLTVQAYTTCEYYMTRIRGYKMIPGKFQGCVPLKTA
jgi:hypothetical protein